MKSWLAYVLHLAAGVAILTCFALPAEAQEDRGISSRLISRCAGKFGATLRAGDQAFPLFSLDGAPWIKIEHAERAVGGVLVADTVTGTGSRLRRRGEVVGFRYTCLVDAKGTVVGFDKSDLLPERNEALPPATLLRGGAFYRPDMQLPRGAELRVQLLDVTHNPVGDLLTEVVVRSSWVQPTPFVLRLPSDTGLENRKPVIMARLVVDSKSVRQLKAPRAVLADELHKPLILMLEAVEQPTN